MSQLRTRALRLAAPGARTPVHRRRALGPFTLIALALGLAALWARIHPTAPPAPLILPSVVVSSGASPARTVSEILQPSRRCALSSAQRTRIQRLAAEETAATAPILARLKSDEAQFGTFVRGVSPRGGASMEEIRRHGETLSADSAHLARTRQFYWSRALQDLTNSQRAAAETP